MNPSFPPPTLDEVQVRAIVRLLGDVSISEGDHAFKKRLLMRGLSGLIQADSWAWGLARDDGPGKPPIHLSLFHEGFTDENYAAFTQAYSHPYMGDVQAAFNREFVEKATHLTRLRQQIDPDDLVLNSEIGPLWEQAGIGPVILSLRPLTGRHHSIIGIYRRPFSPRFNEVDNRIAHVVLSGVPWLHELNFPSSASDTLPALTPRQRLTLDFLIQGYNRQQIAAGLEISLHTANDYVKAVFRHFNVHSQAALISWFKNGDGGDR